MVTVPASTGITAIIKNAVINHVHTKIGIFIMVMPGARILMMVAMILMDPMMEDKPNKCMARIIKSVLGGP